MLSKNCKANIILKEIADNCIISSKRNEDFLLNIIKIALSTIDKLEILDRLNNQVVSNN